MFVSTQALQQLARKCKDIESIFSEDRFPLFESVLHLTDDCIICYRGFHGAEIGLSFGRPPP